MTTITTTTTAPTRNVALTAARVTAALIGILQLAGFSYFLLIVPDDQVVWLGPWIDYPVLTLLLTGVLLKLATALAPALGPTLRVRVGLLAAGLGIAVTLLKMPLYGEPEGVTFLVLDALLVWLLLRARRAGDHP
jgi:hypothetical protein